MGCGRGGGRTDSWLDLTYGARDSGRFAVALAPCIYLPSPLRLPLRTSPPLAPSAGPTTHLHLPPLFHRLHACRALHHTPLHTPWPLPAATTVMALPQVKQRPNRYLLSNTASPVNAAVTSTLPHSLAPSGQWGSFSCGGVDGVHILSFGATAHAAHLPPCACGTAAAFKRRGRTRGGDAGWTYPHQDAVYFMTFCYSTVSACCSLPRSTALPPSACALTAPYLRCLLPPPRSALTAIHHALLPFTAHFAAV